MCGIKQSRGSEKQKESRSGIISPRPADNISEAAGIGRCRLVLSEDHRFLDSIVEKKVVRKKT